MEVEVVPGVQDTSARVLDELSTTLSLKDGADLIFQLNESPYDIKEYIIFSEKLSKWAQENEEESLRPQVLQPSQVDLALALLQYYFLSSEEKAGLGYLERFLEEIGFSAFSSTSLPIFELDSFQKLLLLSIYFTSKLNPTDNKSKLYREIIAKSKELFDGNSKEAVGGFRDFIYTSSNSESLTPIDVLETPIFLEKFKNLTILRNEIKNEYAKREAESLERDLAENRALFPPGFEYLDGIRHAPDQWKPKELKISLMVPIRKDLFKLKRLDASHPAHDGGKGIGAFARVDIPKGTRLGEYSGNLVTEKKYAKLPNGPARDVFCMGFGSLLMIDGFECGNENVKFSDVNQKKDGTKHKVFETIRDVKAGDELMCTYGERYCRNFGIEWYEVDANGDRIKSGKSSK